jgi:outer membrane protein assembly factor BamB
MDKRSGKMLARDFEKIGPDIFHATWSSPSMFRGPGGKEIVFCGGNGRVYGFKPYQKINRTGVSKLEKVWEFDFDPTAPKMDIHKYLSNRREGPSTIYSMPVVDHGRIFVAGGGDLWWGKNEAWLKCIEIKEHDHAEAGTLVWSQSLQKHVLGTPAIYDGLAFIADTGRALHCFDAGDGHEYWKADIQGEVWASPLVADNKLYLGTRDGVFYIFAATREKKLLNETDFSAPISSTAAAANRTIFIATATKLFAVRNRLK